MICNVKLLARLTGILISVLYASALYAQKTPEGSSARATSTAVTDPASKSSASSTMSTAQDGIPIGTRITNDNWQAYKAFMPEGMIALFQGQYFWKMPAVCKWKSALRSPVRCQRTMQRRLRNTHHR